MEIIAPATEDGKLCKNKLRERNALPYTQNVKIMHNLCRGELCSPADLRQILKRAIRESPLPPKIQSCTYRDKNNRKSSASSTQIKNYSQDTSSIKTGRRGRRPLQA